MYEYKLDIWELYYTATNTGNVSPVSNCVAGTLVTGDVLL